MEPLLKGKKFDIDLDATLDFLGHYSLGQYIYPDSMYRNLKLDYDIVYSILELCVEQKILEQNLRILCPVCKKYTGPFYKTLMDVPSESGCDSCDAIMEFPSQYVRVVYKVIV